MTARTYLDHAASSPMPPAVVASMAEILGRAGNPSSLHQSGRTARRVLEEARESLAADLGAHPTEVVFTSGGTEANNLALLGSASPGRPYRAISAIEHASVSGVRERLDGVVILPVDPAGQVRLDSAASLVGNQTAVVSVMWANNETGVVQPVTSVVELAHRVGAIAHSDAVQAFGHLGVDFGASGLDLASVSAHKLGGPVGIGALLVRRGVRLSAGGFGGGQEARLRSGTVPVALAWAFATAARLAVAGLTAESRRLSELSGRLVAAATGQLGGVSANRGVVNSPAIVNLTFDDVRADDLLLLLDAAGIDASTGSACTAGMHQPSDVLLAMGRSLAEAGSSLRFSFGWNTTAADIDRLVEVLPAAVARARAAGLSRSS
jgi:cysteine desulfurase